MLGNANERGNKLVLDLLVDIHSLRADASLATVPEPSPYRALHRPGNVRVVPDNKRRLPSQLQDQLWKMVRGMLHNCPSSISTPSNRNQSSNLVRHKLITNL